MLCTVYRPFTHIITGCVFLFHSGGRIVCPVEEADKDWSMNDNVVVVFSQLQARFQANSSSCYIFVIMYRILLLSYISSININILS